VKAREVVILREVADDLNDGKAFYDQSEPGVGDYFWDSLLADIESLMIYAGTLTGGMLSSSGASRFGGSTARGIYTRITRMAWQVPPSFL
jgi:hypothetical protein